MRLAASVQPDADAFEARLRRREASHDFGVVAGDHHLDAAVGQLLELVVARQHVGHRNTLGDADGQLDLGVKALGTVPLKTEKRGQGVRDVPFSRQLWIEHDDFAEVPPKGWKRLIPGGEVRLRGAGIVRCDEVIKDDSGAIVELRGTLDLESRPGMEGSKRKVKGTIHWVCAKQAVPAEFRLFDRLFTVENPDLDDDGKTYIAWGYRDIRIAELNDTLDDIIPGTERAPFGPESIMGEGAHFLKINGMYYIISAWYAGGFRMPCARAKSPFGPYEIHPSISTCEAFGITQGYRLRSDKGGKFDISAPDPSRDGIATAIHQGGIVDTKSGEWWGYSMMDANSIGRLTCLSPISWVDGWPMFGLPGNVGRTPRTWVKPTTGARTKPSSPYTRSDSFKGPKIANAWQWNHHPDDSKWSLKTRRGWLSLTPQTSPDFWHAKNTLTQRAIGPKSTVTVTIDSAKLIPGDVAGLGLLNHPHGWIGIRRSINGEHQLTMFHQETGNETSVALPKPVIQLRAECDFLSEMATFSWSVDGLTWQVLGSPFRMVFQLRTFQGVRYALFAYNTLGNSGGRADFTNFTVHEPAPRGLMNAIPYGQLITIENAISGHTLAASGQRLISIPASNDNGTSFRIIDVNNGRVAIQHVNTGCFGLLQQFNGGHLLDVFYPGVFPGFAQLFILHKRLQYFLAVFNLAGQFLALRNPLYLLLQNVLVQQQGVRHRLSAALQFFAHLGTVLPTGHMPSQTCHRLFAHSGYAAHIGGFVQRFYQLSQCPRGAGAGVSFGQCT